MDSLTLNNEMPVWTFGQGDGQVCETMCLATLSTGEMRVTLSLAAVVRQFVMAGPFLQEYLVHKIGFGQAVQRAINSHPVKAPIKCLCNLFLCDRPVRMQERFDDAQAGLCAIELGCFEHGLGL